MTSTIGLVTPAATVSATSRQAFQHAAPLARLVTAGALDGVGAAALPGWHDPHGEYPIYLPQPQGEALQIPIDRLVPRVAAGVERLERAGAELVVVLCAGDFPDLSSTVPVIYPGRLALDLVTSTMPKARAGLLLPVPGQIEVTRSRWAAEGHDVLATELRPGASAEAADAVCAALREFGAQVIVMACMGYGDSDVRNVRHSLPAIPIISASRLAIATTAVLAA